MLFAGAAEPAKAAQGQAGALLFHHQPPEGDRDPCHHHQAPPVRYRYSYNIGTSRSKLLSFKHCADPGMLMSLYPEFHFDEDPFLPPILVWDWSGSQSVSKIDTYRDEHGFNNIFLQVLWIRPALGIGIRIQEGQFWSARCSLLRDEDFSCSLDVLYGGQGISKMLFLSSEPWI